MKFGPVDAARASGAILAHAVQVGERRWKKGRALGDADVAALAAAGIDSVVAARLEPGDVAEDAAADALAAALVGPGCSAGAAFTGRANLFAERPGVLQIDRDVLAAVNAVSEDLTVATLTPFTPLAERQMAATIKIIPFAVADADLRRCLAAARRSGDAQTRPAIDVLPFRLRRVGLIQTTLPGIKTAVLDKTTRVLDARLEPFGARLCRERRCAHDGAALAAAIVALIDDDGAELVLIAGASAIVDRRDVIPAAIAAAGGAVEHFGMPVDPGNLLLLGYRHDVATVGLPGCARSPAFNGIDLLLPRLIAGQRLGVTDITELGVGGLLKEISGRGLPRRARAGDAAASPARAPRVAGVVLAAGRSRRMGEINKLLAEIDGVPMVRRVVERALASRLCELIVVTGFEAERVREAVGTGAGRALRFVDNPHYRDGISSSLRAAATALHGDAGGAPEIDAMLVCLGDMPDVGPDDINRLIAAFDPLEGRAICVPTHRGKRGNPVLWGRQFFAAIAELSGDVGARPLLAEQQALVCEVELNHRGVLTDVDSPQDLSVRVGRRDGGGAE